eukprot:738208-Amorphochlora_amoeboformis.AAC.1
MQTKTKYLLEITRYPQRFSEIATPETIGYYQVQPGYKPIRRQGVTSRHATFRNFAGRSSKHSVRIFYSHFSSTWKC